MPNNFRKSKPFKAFVRRFLREWFTFKSKPQVKPLGEEIPPSNRRNPPAKLPPPRDE